MNRTQREYVVVQIIEPIVARLKFTIFDERFNIERLFPIYRDTILRHPDTKRTRSLDRMILQTWDQYAKGFFRYCFTLANQKLTQNSKFNRNAPHPAFVKEAANFFERFDVYIEGLLIPDVPDDLECIQLVDILPNLRFRDLSLMYHPDKNYPANRERATRVYQKLVGCRQQRMFR